MSAGGNDSIAAIAGSFGNRPEMLVQVLVAVVRKFGWVSPDVIRELADILNLSRADVHGVVEFYDDFRTTPPAKHVVRVCQAEACQSMGGRELAEHVRTVAGDDVTLEPVYCLGVCACAPAVMVNGKTHGGVDAAQFDTLLADAVRS